MTGGAESVEIAARDVRELLRALDVRFHLQAKLANEEPRVLEPEQEAWLESHVAEQKIDPAALATLAATRAAAAQSLLVREHGIAAERLPIGPPVTEPPAAKPGVAIGLGAPRKAPPS